MAALILIKTPDGILHTTGIKIFFENGINDEPVFEAGVVYNPDTARYEIRYSGYISPVKYVSFKNENDATLFEQILDSNGAVLNYADIQPEKLYEIRFKNISYGKIIMELN